jgi:16S rRNA processing protein RimM
MFNLEKDKENYFYLGKIIKTHAYHGELVFLLETKHPESYTRLKMVFIDIENSLIPWFVESIEISNERAVVKLEDINTLEDARSFVKRELYLPNEQLSAPEATEFYFHEIIGFRVIDAKHGEIGVVDDILKRPEQEIIRIIKESKEILVPLTDEMIAKVDKENKILYLDTPEGLIDIYL